MHFQSESESMTYILTSELLSVNIISMPSSTQAYNWLCLPSDYIGWSFLTFQIEEAVEGEATHIQKCWFRNRAR